MPVRKKQGEKKQGEEKQSGEKQETASSNYQNCPAHLAKSVI